MKKIIKVIIFLLIFVILFCIVSKLLWLEPNAISYFYKEPKNSLDVVYIGASNAYIHFNTVLGYNLYGYTTGLLSTDSQPFVLVEYLIRESEKTQRPSLYIIDLTKIAENTDDYTEANVRKTVDSMKNSKNRINAIDKVLSYNDEIDTKEYINLYLSFLLYHNSWSDINKIKKNITGNEIFYKGYFFGGYTSKVEKQESYNWEESIIDLPQENKQILMDLIDYIKENNLNVLFVIPVRTFDEEYQKKLNSAITIIQNNDLEVINCNNVEELNNINFSTDLYNFAHLNVYGATKYTLWFSKYLKENYNLPDHRNDAKYSSWDSEYKRFKDDFKKITDKNFDDILLEYNQK